MALWQVAARYPNHEPKSVCAGPAGQGKCWVGLGGGCKCNPFKGKETMTMAFLEGQSVVASVSVDGG